MRVLKITPYGFACNSYIITADDKTAVVIDPAQPRITEELRNNNLECGAVLLTHGHFDHVGGCGVLWRAGVPIYCSTLEKPLIFSSEYFGLFGGVYVPQFKIAGTLDDNQKITLCEIDFTTMLTPGHSAGSMCYVAEDAIFSGDTVFKESIGRSDLYTGNQKQLLASLNKILCLDKSLKIYCGHDADTTVGHERKYNPYARRDIC